MSVDLRRVLPVLNKIQNILKVKYPEFIGFFIKGSRMSQFSYKMSKSRRKGLIPDLDVCIAIRSNQAILEDIVANLEGYVSNQKLGFDFTCVNISMLKSDNLKQNILKHMVPISPTTRSNQDHLL